MLLRIVKKLRLESEFRPDVLEELRDCIDVKFFIEHTTWWTTPGSLAFPGVDETAAAVAAQLHPDVAEALFHRALDGLDTAIECSVFTRMVIHGNRSTATASQKLI